MEYLSQVLGFFYNNSHYFAFAGGLVGLVHFLRKRRILLFRNKMPRGNVVAPPEIKTKVTQLYPNRLWLFTLPGEKKHNMIVYRLNSGNLLIHAPLKLPETDFTLLEELGDPEIAILPNQENVADFISYKERYPELSLLCPKHYHTKISERISVDKTCEEFFSRDSIHGVTLFYPPINKYHELHYEVSLSDKNREYGLLTHKLFFTGPRSSLLSLSMDIVTLFSNLWNSHQILDDATKENKAKFNILQIPRKYSWFGYKSSVMKQYVDLLVNSQFRVVTFSFGEPISTCVSEAFAQLSRSDL